MSESVRAAWLSQWHLGVAGSVAAALLLQALLSYFLPDGRQLLRKHLIFGVLCGVLNLIGRLLAGAGLAPAAEMVGELSLLAWGILMLRIASLALFRLLLPALRMPAPRIMQDLLFALACIGWGLARLRYAGLDISGVVTTSAIITGIIAISMQETLGNILGGLALQLDHSVRIGDWIKFDDVRGKVIEIHWRHTSVLTNNGEIVVVPNSALMKSKVDVYCSADNPAWRRTVRFATGYAPAPSQVVAGVEQAMRAAQIANVAPEPPPQCIVTDYRDGSTHYALRYWLTDPRFDEATDSTVRLHLYSCLQRLDLELARPCMDVSVSDQAATESADAARLAQREQALAKVKLLSSLNADELQQLAATLRSALFTRNDVMTRQGAVANWLYVLVSGEADVWYENGAERTHLATLRAGDVFGEMGLMTGEPRRATVTARTDAECYRIDKQSFETILLARPELASELARLLDERDIGLSAARIEDAAVREDRQANLLQRIRRFFGLLAMS